MSQPKVFKAARSSGPGFTLIEVLVAIFIITVISGAVGANYRSAEKSTSLRNGTAELVSVLRRAQADSMSGFQYQGTAVRDVRLNLNTATNTNYKLCVNVQYCSSSIVESVAMPEGVFIQGIQLGSTSATNVDIVFAPPFGDVSYEGQPFGRAATQKLTIILANQEGRTASVVVDPISGRVSQN